jgi:thiol-disulfide isomerase/thioredoxin
MNPPGDDRRDALLVACLCASWCGTCRDYAPVFEGQAAAGDADYAWVDIEDHEEILDGIDVENFPTLLIARGDDVLFFGPVTPQPGTLARMVQAARDGALRPVPAPVPNLPGRVRQIRDSA